MLVLSKYYFSSPTLVTNLAVLAISFVLSALVTKYENIIRALKLKPSVLLVSSASISLLLLIIGQIGVLHINNSSLQVQKIIMLDQAKNLGGLHNTGIIGKDADKYYGQRALRIDRQDNLAIDFLILGDSHVTPMAKAMDIMGKEYKLNGINAEFLNFLFGGSRVSSYEEDTTRWQREQEHIIKIVEKYNIKNVILIGRWSWYIHGFLPAETNEYGKQFYLLIDDKTQTDRKTIFVVALKNTIKRLQEAGVKNIWITTPVPENSFHVPEKVVSLLAPEDYPRQRAGVVYCTQEYMMSSLVNHYGVSVSDYDARHSIFFEVVKELFNEAQIINVHDALLSLSNVPSHYPLLYHKTSLYVDDDHLSFSGAMMLGPIFVPILEQIKNDRQAGS